MIIVSVLLVIYNNVNAQTIESRTGQKELLVDSPQIMVGRVPTDIKINQYTNKIYVANSESDSVSAHGFFYKINRIMLSVVSSRCLFSAGH
jgi:DNA-binding beta-propeller fold protein YncE